MINKEYQVGSINLKQIGSVAQLTLSRPEALNALTWDMYEQLDDHLSNLADDPSIKVLIIRGEGDKAFAAGTDISQFRNFSGEDGLDYENKMEQITQKLDYFPKPTIAAINGYAIGGGLIISTACDLRYATPKSKFGSPMARTLGNCLSLDNYQRLASAVGPMRTKELLYTARNISAEEAFSIGFLTDILEEESFFDKVLEIATKISENAPLTIEATKTAFNMLAENNVTANLKNDFNDVISKVYGSGDFAEGVESYVDKRRPVWKGE